MLIKRCLTSHQRGWIMIEVIAAAALLATVVSVFQTQHAQLNQSVIATQEAYRQQQRMHLQKQIKEIFNVDIELPKSPVSVPRCKVCQGAGLRQVLAYELSQ